jgi:pSer/pThr/pTyr-binding forkhead associated (FHA) protein
MPRIIITVPGKKGQPYRFDLESRKVTIGRGSDNDIVIESGSVSTKHAEMRRVSGGYELRDVGSTNGFKHLGVRHDKIALVSGMSLMMGDVTFDFNLTDDELSVISQEKPAAKDQKPKKVRESKSKQLPKPKQLAKPTLAPVSQQSSELSFSLILLFFLLAAGAIFAGLSVRYEKETGAFLLKDIVNKSDFEKSAAAPEK